MLKAKKPITKPAAQPTPSALKSTALKRKPAAEPEPAEEEPVTEEPDEDPEPEPTSVKRGLKKSAKVKSKRSLAEMFDSSKPKGIFPLGEFTGYIADFKLVGEIADDIEDQGPLHAEVVFEAHEDEQDAEGNGIGGETITSRYTLVTKSGEFNEMGAGILRQDLDKLGYAEDVAIMENLEQIFQDIIAERPAIVFKTVQNKQFVNAYLQGLAETN